MALTVATDGVALFQVPPVMLGVNVVVEPTHKFVVPDIVGVGLTLIVIALDVAGVPVAQRALDVRMQVIISPLAGV